MVHLRRIGLSLFFFSFIAGTVQAEFGKYPICRVSSFANGKDEFIGQILVREKQAGLRQYCYQTLAQVSQTRITRHLQCSPTFDEQQVLRAADKGESILSIHPGLAFFGGEGYRMVSIQNGDTVLHTHGGACKDIPERSLRIGVGKLALSRGLIKNPEDKAVLNRGWIIDPEAVRENGNHRTAAAVDSAKAALDAPPVNTAK